MHDETVAVRRCECGCGEVVGLTVKGSPRRFLRGHHLRAPGLRDAHRAAWTEAGIEYGLCLCGCGETTPSASSTCVAERRLRGEHCHYVNGGHRNRRGWRIIAEDRGYTTPCHIWQGACDEHGYGNVHVGDRKKAGTHRVAYEREHGPIPDGLVIDHLCRVPPCCNPNHLEVVTPTENMRRGLTTKLTAEQVLEIRRASGTQRSIAERYGVTANQVGNIRRGEAWRDLL